MEGEPRGDVQKPVAQALGLGARELATKQQALCPGDEVVGDEHEREPYAVVLEVAKGQIAQPRVLVFPDVVFDTGALAVAALEDGDIGVGLVGEDRLEAVTAQRFRGHLRRTRSLRRQLVHAARSALHATRRGRDMDCEVVRLALGEADGKTPRDRRVRAHLASCEDWRAFQRSIRTRRSALAAVVPPLAPWAAGDLLGRLLEGGPSSGAGLATGGGNTVT